MSNDTTSHTPSHIAYQVREVKDKGYWNRIGVAWQHKGFNIQLESVPLDGRIQLRVAAESSAMTSTTINPYYAARIQRPVSSAPGRNAPNARLARASITTSPVPHLTSVYHSAEGGDYVSGGYPGNCGGNIIKDLLRYFRPRIVFDPMTGSGTCRVCDELAISCWSSDMHQGVDACDAPKFPRACFDFAWVHPPYWRQKLYTNESRDLSRTPTLDAFLDRYHLLIENCAGAVTPGGKVAILMGDYSDREAGYVPLVYWTKYLAFNAGFRPGYRSRCASLTACAERSPLASEKGTGGSSADA